MENNTCRCQKSYVMMDKVSCINNAEETNPTMSTDPDSESVMCRDQKINSWGNISSYNNNMDPAVEDIQMKTSNKNFTAYGLKPRFSQKYTRENKWPTSISHNSQRENNMRKVWRLHNRRCGVRSDISNKHNKWTLLEKSRFERQKCHNKFAIMHKLYNKVVAYLEKKSESLEYYEKIRADALKSMVWISRQNRIERIWHQ